MNRLKRYLRGLAGYMIDLCRIATLNFINPHSYTKFFIIDRVRKKTQSRIFIETGTNLGVTADRCASRFDKVYTIELDKNFARQASDFLAGRKNVKVIHQDGLEALPRLLQDKDTNDVLLFLDGHFSGGEAACGIMPEPAVEELRILSNYKEKIKAIIVDDFRCFGSQHAFPSKSELLKTAEDCFANYGFEIAVQLDQLIIMRK